MPASRSAAATTLAPRSCPSRPGLPTRTRILRCMRSPIGSGFQGTWRPSSSIADPGTLARPWVLVPNRQLRLGGLVAPARLLEILRRRRDHALVVDGLQDHSLFQEQVQRRFGGFTGRERVEAKVPVAAQGLEPPRARGSGFPHDART